VCIAAEMIKKAKKKPKDFLQPRLEGASCTFSGQMRKEGGKMDSEQAQAIGS
jgi:hypothetical protein